MSSDLTLSNRKTHLPQCQTPPGSRQHETNTDCGSLTSHKCHSHKLCLTHLLTNANLSLWSNTWYHTFQATGSDAELTPGLIESDYLISTIFLLNQYQPRSWGSTFLFQTSVSCHHYWKVQFPSHYSWEYLYLLSFFFPKTKLHNSTPAEAIKQNENADEAVGVSDKEQ